MSTFTDLRQRHSQLIYRAVSWQILGQDLELSFDFELSPDLNFQARLIFKNFPLARWPELKTATSLEELPITFAKLFFNLGLAEIPSYWKAACPAEIILYPPSTFSLSAGELSWWRDLLIKGLGEFFYQNQIDFREKNFLSFKQNLSRDDLIETEDSKFNSEQILDNFQDKSVSDYLSQLSKGKILVPVGGGKDSATVLGILEKAKLNYDVLLLAPHSPAASKIAKIFQEQGHCQNIIELERQIDPQLLQLNQSGYLNGHTPFSAYLAFAASAAAYFYGQEQIVLANESSADEENNLYLGQKINHQYSKSKEFEAKFQWYAKQSLFKELVEQKQTMPQYFSLLRSMSELSITQLLCQIAQTDQRFLTVLQEFRSCNVGQKEGLWCEACPKCAFVFLMLSACLEPEKVSPGIFTKNLLADEQLFSTYQDLLGKGEKKPFECVGTFAESQSALLLTKQQYQNSHSQIPENLQRLLDLLENKSETEKKRKD